MANADKAAKIKRLRKQTSYGPERIAFYLQRDHGITMAPSTSTKLFTEELIKEAPFPISCIQTDGAALSLPISTYQTPDACSKSRQSSPKLGS